MVERARVEPKQGPRPARSAAPGSTRRTKPTSTPAGLQDNAPSTPAGRTPHVGLQHTAGNRVVLRVSQPDPGPIRRDILPGATLPDPKAIGQQRAEARERGTGAVAKRLFLDKLVAVLDEDSLFIEAVKSKVTRLRKFYTDKNSALPAEEAKEKTKADVAQFAPEIADGVGAWWTMSQIVDEATASTSAADKEPDAIKARMDQEMTPGGKEWALANDAFNKAQARVIPDTPAAVQQEWTAQWNQRKGTSFGTEPTKAERAGFSKALRKLPSLTAMAAAHGGDPSAIVVGPMSPVWQNGGTLADGIVEDPTDSKKVAIPPKKQFRKPIDKGTFRSRVVKADQMIRALVEAEILRALPRPTIKVHPQSESKFRAYQNGAEVHVAADEPIDIIVHEVGHYIEKNGPLESWADIQKLVMARHQAAGGGTAAQKGGSTTKKEGRFGGTYAATGKYTSKAYSSGDTEVMSMSMEYLANPKKFDKLLDKDPVQAAIVLRGLQPAAYAAEGSLRNFDRFLP